MIACSVITIQWLDLWSPVSVHDTNQDDLPKPIVRMMSKAIATTTSADTEKLLSKYSALPAWFSKYIVILDLRDGVFYGDPTPQEIALANQISETQLFVFAEDKQTAAQKLNLRDGRPIVLIVRNPKSYFPRIALFVYHYWQLSLVALIVSGLACWVVAGIMTRDIRILREAVNNLSSGNFDAATVSNQLHSGAGEIGQLGRAFDEMSTKLQHAMLEQRRLVKDVSHELRSPLARLEVALAIAQQKAEPSIHPELERIKDASAYLGEIITGILSMPINENEEWDLDDTVDLCLLIDHLVEVYEEQAKDRNVIFEFITDHDSVLVMTHNSTIVGVFENVIRNALRYTNSGSRITIGLRVIGNSCQIDIADRGTGVCPQMLESIFEPFCRADEARDRDTGGFGLGLAIAKRTVRLHKGTIFAKNNEYGGLTITITLPRANEDNGE